MPDEIKNQEVSPTASENSYEFNSYNSRYISDYYFGYVP